MINYEYNPVDDKIMREVIDSYKKVMNGNDQIKENLFLKKLRFSHPWFRHMQFNSFKMVFDTSQLVQIRWG